jgi:Na+-translocating ferredoxin:NAD+ oxidoreductase RnfA subunit
MADPVLDYERPRKVQRTSPLLWILGIFVALITFVGTFAFAGLVVQQLSPHGRYAEVVWSAISLFLSYCCAALTFRAIAGVPNEP